MLFKILAVKRLRIRNQKWQDFFDIFECARMLRGKSVNTYSDRHGKAVHELSVHCWRAVLSSEILGHLLRGKRVNTYGDMRGKAVRELCVH